MKKRYSLRGLIALSPLAVTGLWTLIVLVIWHQQWLGIAGWELQSYNFRFHQRGVVPPDNRIAFLAIDDASIFGESLDEEDTEYIKKNPGYELLRDFPYPRKTYVLAIEKLVKAGARVVVFDLVLSKESPLGQGNAGKADDVALTRALIKYRDKVVIGANFTSNETGSEAVRSMEALTMPHSNLLPSSMRPKIVPELPDKEIVGYVNYAMDPDTFIRRMDPVGWPFSNEGKKTLETLPYSIDALAVKKAFPEIKLPRPFEFRFIKFAGPNGTYNPIPFHLLFRTKAWEPGRPPLYEGKVFKDKIVLIGPRANFMHDDHTTPFGAGVAYKMFGPDIHCNAIATLLSPHVLREVGAVTGLVIIGLFGLVYAFILRIPKSPLGKFVPAIGFGLYYLGLAQWTFEGLDLFIPLTPVAILLVGSTVSVVTLQAIIEQIEKRRVSGMFQSYISKNVAQELIKSGQDVNSLMIPRRREVTVLFSDVRDFTTMTEGSDPVRFVQQLNEYLTAMVECVFDNHGTLDKFVGDAVMAVYGNPTSLGKAEDAWCAVKTAIEMRKRLADLNERWEKEERTPFRIGIGLNHGPVMAGDIGSSQKKEYGVIGDTVNVTSRVEGLTKEQKADILITDTVYDLVQDRLNADERGEMTVKGRAKPVKIYALKSLKTTANLSASTVGMKFEG